MSRNREYLLLALILGLGLVLRLAAMDERSLMDDEVNIALATREGYGNLLTNFGGGITQPALLVASRFCQQSFGEFLGMENSMRLPSLLAGLFCIVVVHRLARRLLTPGAGLLAALFLAAHPFHVFYSQMATAYALVCTLCLLSTDALISLARSVRADPVSSGSSLGRGVLAYVLWTALAIYGHLGCLGVVLGQLASLPLLMFTPGAQRKRWLARMMQACVVIGIASALGIALYAPAWGPLMEFREAWTQGGFTLEFVPLFLTAVSGGRGLSIYALVAVVLLGLRAGSRSARGREFLAVVVLGPLGVLAFYWLNDSSHYAWAHVRFFFVTMPALAIACASGLAVLGRAAWPRSARSMPRAVLASSLLIIVAWSQSSKVIQIAWGPKDARATKVVEYIDAEMPPGSLIVSMPMRFSALSHYYLTLGEPSSEVLDTRTLRDRLDDSQSTMLFDRPVLFAVDLVAFESAPWESEWIIRRFGTTTLLHRPEGHETTKRQTIRELVLIVDRVLDYLETPVSGGPPDWVYWRIDAAHQHMFRRRAVIVNYRMLYRALLRPSSPKPPPRPDFDAPEPEYWTMVAPHADFWPGGCPLGGCSEADA